MPFNLHHHSQSYLVKRLSNWAFGWVNLLSCCHEVCNSTLDYILSALHEKWKRTICLEMMRFEACLLVYWLWKLKCSSARQKLPELISQSCVWAGESVRVEYYFIVLFKNTKCLMSNIQTPVFLSNWSPSAVLCTLQDAVPEVSAHWLRRRRKMVTVSGRAVCTQKAVAGESCMSHWHWWCVRVCSSIEGHRCLISYRTVNSPPMQLFLNLYNLYQEQLSFSLRFFF